MSGNGSSNTPGSMWTQCATYARGCHDGTILRVSESYGDTIKTLTTMASPSMLNSPSPLSELLTELRELWPLLQPEQLGEP